MMVYVYNLYITLCLLLIWLFRDKTGWWNYYPKPKDCGISLHRLRYWQLLILLELSIYLYRYLNQLCLYFLCNNTHSAGDTLCKKCIKSFKRISCQSKVNLLQRFFYVDFVWMIIVTSKLKHKLNYVFCILTDFHSCQYQGGTSISWSSIF